LNAFLERLLCTHRLLQPTYVAIAPNTRHNHGKRTRQQRTETARHHGSITAASRQHHGSNTTASRQQHGHSDDNGTDTATTTTQPQRRRQHGHNDDSNTDTPTTATRTQRRQQQQSTGTQQAKTKHQIDSITTERQRGKSKNGCKTNVYSPRKFSATQKISSLVQKIQGNVSAKSIQISRYTRLYNNMRHQCTHEEFTIDDDAPTTSEDVTLRQEIYPVGRISMSMVPSKISSTNTWKF
jgi:hypothetical protein